MKRFWFPLLAAGLFAFTSCDNNKSQTAENGNASDEYMNSGTHGDSSAVNGADASAEMPANASNPANQPENAGTARMANNDPNAQNTAEAPHATDEEFMKSAAHSDQNEIQQSRMALAKGVKGMVKAHADMMIADHTKSTADLKKIAAKKGVTLPTDMDAEHKALAPTLQKLNSEEFSAQYMEQMIADHQKTVNTMKSHAQMTKDPELKAFIAKTLPVVQKHLDNSRKHADMGM
jgi:putative membrane protein